MAGSDSIPRATLEAIAFEVRDVCGAMADASAARPRVLKADGGASENDLLMRLQAEEAGLDFQMIGPLPPWHFVPEL